MKKFYLLQKIFYLIESSKHNLISIANYPVSEEFNHIILEYYMQFNLLSSEIYLLCEKFQFPLIHFKAYKKSLIKLNLKLNTFFLKTEVKLYSVLLTAFSNHLVIFDELKKQNIERNLSDLFKKTEETYQKILSDLTEKLKSI